jgi:hypothetical protein
MQDFRKETNQSDLWAKNLVPTLFSVLAVNTGGRCSPNSDHQFYGEQTRVLKFSVYCRGSPVRCLKRLSSAVDTELASNEVT